MSKIARVYVHHENEKYDASGARSAGACANYLLRGEENKKKGSIRGDSFWIAKGLGAKSYHRTPGDVIRGWKWLDQEWLKSRNSRGNKRKKTVKYGAVDHQATVVFQTGLITLPNGIEPWKAKILARRIMAEFPDDCPFMATMHFGKEYDEREEDNYHLHYMFSCRHDHGIGKGAEELVQAIFDKKTPKGRQIIQDKIENVVRQFYIDFGYEVVENSASQKKERRLERLVGELKKVDEELEKSKASDEKKDEIRRFRKRKILSDLEVVEKEYAEKIKDEERNKYEDELDNITSRVEALQKFKDEFDNRRVDDSFDKEEKVYYRADDVIAIDDGSDLELMKKDGREMILKKKNLSDSRRREEDEIDKENYINEQKNIEIQNQASLGNEFFGITNIQRNTNRFRKLAKRIDPNSQQYKNMQAILSRRKLKPSKSTASSSIVRKLKSSEDRIDDNLKTDFGNIIIGSHKIKPRSR